MINIVLQKGNVKYSFRYNGYIHCVVVETDFGDMCSSHTYQVTKENGNRLYKMLLDKGYERSK